jgi:hypothetical protein
MVSDTLIFLFLSYLPLFPLLFYGIKKYKGNLQLNAWILWVAIALSIVFVSPNALFPVGPHRWIILLTYPLCFFAVGALSNLKSVPLKAVAFGILAATSISFMVLPGDFAFPYFGMFPAYAPSPMTQNTVPLRDCQSTLDAVNWVKDNMHQSDHLMVHDAFGGWAMLVLSSEQLFFYGYENPDSFAQKTVNLGLGGKLYLIWWVNGWGGHGLVSVPSSFKEVFESGKIAVYVYQSDATA